MEAQRIRTPAPEPTFTLTESGLSVQVARVISGVGSPPVLTATAVFLAASVIQSTESWGWTAVYLLLVIVVPLLYIVWMVQQGKATDYDLSDRRQRIGPMFLTLTSATAAWAILTFSAAPRLLVILATANMLQATFFFAITLFWKISIHAAVAAALAVLTWFMFGIAAWPFAAAVPFIAWSRLRLRRHTALQTIAGAILGSALLIAILHFYGV